MKIRDVALIVLTLSAVGCSNKSGAGKVEAAAKPREPLAVRVAALEERQIKRAISVTGSLLPDETVTVSAEVAGRVMEIRADFGQSVRRGEVIAVLDPREFSLQLDRGRASLAQALARVGLNPNQEDATPKTTPGIRQAEAQCEDAKFKFESAARLIKTGDISQERFTEIEKSYRARQAALEAAQFEFRMQLAAIQALRAEVRLAEKRLSDATVRAPFDGAISARMVSPGQYIKDNTPLVTLVKTHPLRLRAEAPETFAAEIRPGALLSFRAGAAPGTEFHAVVREINPSLEARSRTLVVEARIRENDPRLKPGMFVQVELGTAGDQAAVVAPKEAVYQVAGLAKVFRVRDGRAEGIKIAPGADFGNWVEIPGQSLRAGDQVAVSNLAMLVDGAAVKTETR